MKTKMPRIVFPCVLIVFFVGIGMSAHGQVPVVRNVLSYSSSERDEMGQPTGNYWNATKTETYNVSSVMSATRDLATAALSYSTEHGNHFPDLARELFSLGYVTDPLTFYNPGDANDPPTTINNDVINGPNSSRISFDYFGLGQTSFDPNAILFQDNTPANNFGLGKVTAYADGHSDFVSAIPHVFHFSDFALGDDSETQIYRPVTGWQPYSMPLPIGMQSESLIAPHRFEMRTESNITSDVHDVFLTEGYFDSNFAAASSSTVLSFLDMRVTGPGEMVPVTIYVHFSGNASREPTDLSDSVLWNATLISSFEGVPQTRGSAYFAWTQYGLFPYGKSTFLVHRILDPGDQGYLPGHDSVYVEGIAQLTVEVPTNETGTMALITSVGATTPMTPATFGAHKVGAIITELPHWFMQQLIVYVPPGYEVVLEFSEPIDMIRSVVRGDYDYDGFVSGADYDAFEDAYSGPLPKSGFVPPTSYRLSAFDFDGDADVDCADFNEFSSNWSFGPPPFPIPPCEFDDDDDGIPDGDDECVTTAPGTLVDDRGCPRGDFNADSDVDLSDWSWLVQCMPTEVSFPLPPPPYLLGHCWNSFDTDGDRQVRIPDVAEFQNSFTGSMP